MRSNNLLIRLLFFTITFYSFYRSHAQQNDTLAIEGISIIDVKTGVVSNDQSILIIGNKIIAISNSGELSIPKNAHRIDGQRKFILPGLIDGHTHMSANQNRERDLQAMLRLGITSVRDMGGNAMVYKELAQKALSGEIQIPDIYYSANLFGPEFMVDKRVQFAAGPYEPGQSPWMRLIEPTTDLEAVMDEAVKHGVTGVKLYSSLSPDQITAITELAKQKGLQVWGHATIFPSKPSDFVKARPDAISHALPFAFEVYNDIPNEFNKAILTWLPTKNLGSIDAEDERLLWLYKTMKEKDIIFEPTISAWKTPDGEPKEMKSAVNPNLKKAGEALDISAIVDLCDRITIEAIEQGVKISAGTDQTFQMKWVQDEIIFLNELGLSPLEAIRAATLTNAEALGLEDQFGSIEVGKKADLLILDGNPLTDINNMREVHMVLKGGSVIIER